MKKKLKKYQSQGEVKTKTSSDTTYTGPQKPPISKSPVKNTTDAEKKAAFTKATQAYNPARVAKPAKPGAEPIVWTNYKPSAPQKKKGGPVKKKK